MKKLVIVLLFILGVSLFYRIFIYHHLTQPQDSLADYGKYAVYQFSLPKSLSFAGEKIPLEDAQVRDRLIKLLMRHTYANSQTLELHKMSARWFPMIERILRKYKIPDDFKYLVLVESGFGNEISRKGASGYWQFLPSTAMHYELEISDQVDERHNVEKSTKAACKYLRDNYRMFKNWTLTAAAYNMGAVALLKQMKLQNEKSYYDLILNKETSGYLFKILTMKEIIARPGLYGYRFKKKELYSPIPAKNIVVDSSITDLNSFAQFHHTTLPLLKLMNPWIKTNQLLNSGRKKYTIKIVLKGFENLPGLYVPMDSLQRKEMDTNTSDSVVK